LKIPRAPARRAGENATATSEQHGRQQNKKGRRSPTLDLDRARHRFASALLPPRGGADYIFFAFFLAFFAICRPSAKSALCLTPMENTKPRYALRGNWILSRTALCDAD
jgi:hypothetical protein